MSFERNVVRLPDLVFVGHVYPKVGRFYPPPPLHSDCFRRHIG